jgi:DHA2 family multidrug resistance protein
LSVFRSRGFSAGNFIGIISGFGLFGTALVFPLFFQNVLGFTATLTGLALLPGALATAISMPIAARLSKWVDGRISIAFGLLLFAIGAWTMGDLNANAGFSDVLWPRIVQGFALGFLFVPLSTKTLAGIPRDRLANATGIYTLVRQLGGSLGIAILQLALTRNQDEAYARLASAVTLANPSVARMVGGAPAVPPATAQHLMGMVEVNATILSYNYVIQLCAIVFLVAIPSVLLLSGKTKTAGPPEPIAIE